MLLDLHVHTFESGDAIAAPEEVFERALALGIHGVCVTEHDSYAASEGAALLGEDSGLLVLRGVEVTTDVGHFLVYGVEDDGWQQLRRDGVIGGQTLVDYVRGLGGVAIPAHPFRVDATSVGEGLMAIAGLFAIEGFNGSATRRENVEACELAARFGLRLIGGSDAHLPGRVGRAVTQFERDISSITGLVAELKAGRFFGRYLLPPL
jgi:predicted metal-dependent phosphoesterase TrpH